MGLIPTYSVKKHKCKYEGCDCEFVKFNGLQKYCRKHEIQVKLDKRISKAKKVNPKPFKKVKPIRKVALKRAEQNKEYMKLRKIFLKDTPICQYMDCEYRSIEIHHRYSGSDRNKYFLDTRTWMAVCRDCHNRIHENPTQSKKYGYLK